MRIAQIMLSDGWGGAERLFVELCSGLAAEGHEVLAVCKPGFEQGRQLSSLHNLSYATIPARCNWDYLSVFQLKRLVSDFKADLLHAHLARASRMTGIVGRSLELPTISTTHNRIKKKYVSRIGYFTTITGDLKAYLEQLDIERDRVRKVPNFSRLEAVDAVACVRNSPLTFVALGRFVRKKGFDVLLDAFKRYVETSPVPARLVLGGDGPLDRQLRRQADNLGIANLVEFKGWVDDIASCLDAADIFILPSLDEPFGIVLLEAMARGKPIITTDVSGPRDFLDDSTAFFTHAGDSEGMSKTMRTAAENPELCRKKAELALELFREKYTYSAVLPQFVAVYESILSRRSL